MEGLRIGIAGIDDGGLLIACPFASASCSLICDRTVIKVMPRVPAFSPGRATYDGLRACRIRSRLSK